MAAHGIPRGGGVGFELFDRYDVADLARRAAAQPALAFAREAQARAGLDLVDARADQALDFLGRFGAALGERAHFRGDDGEAAGPRDLLAGGQADLQEAQGLELAGGEAVIFSSSFSKTISPLFIGVRPILA